MACGSLLIRKAVVGYVAKARPIIGLTAGRSVARFCALACRHSPLGRDPSALLTRIDELLSHGHITEVDTCSIPHSRHVIQRKHVNRGNERRSASKLCRYSPVSIVSDRPRPVVTCNRGLRSLQDLKGYFEVETGSAPLGHSESAHTTTRIVLGLCDNLKLTCGLLSELKLKPPC
ncbi:hypothetical protein BGY98DRAFT_63748 [Russula aff. rugulosa BPL654]|nr:hypothetical protein BGY98DRAFT_63748 [Russula aff. rugulosa BPL654]